MNITYEELKKALEEAYDRGWRGSLELKEQIVNEISAKITFDKDKQKTEEKITEKFEWNYIGPNSIYRSMIDNASVQSPSVVSYYTTSHTPSFTSYVQT